MLELLLCSLVTVFPDYLVRRFVQGKRFGREITFYSVWYELRYGITACLILTVGLITIIFYNHPSSASVTAVYRSIPIVPEIGGRVAETYIGVSGSVAAGAPLFRLDSATQQAALELARNKIREVEAGIVVAQSEIASAEAQIRQATATLQDAQDELATKQELNRRNAGIVAKREIERLQKAVDGDSAARDAAMAAKDTAEKKVSTQLPAERASAEAALRQAEVELAKMVVRAGVEGQVEQFALRVGDYVTPFMRPAGVLVPKNAGRQTLVAGFDQVEGQVMKAGMIAEATCASKPWTVIPMVVTRVQDYIASGQFRVTDQLIDVQTLSKPGTITVFLEPLYEGGLTGVLPGSACYANAYTSNHDRLELGTVGRAHAIYLHGVDTVSIVHAMLLRLQALILPIRTLVLSGH